MGFFILFCGSDAREFFFGGVWIQYAIWKSTYVYIWIFHVCKICAEIDQNTYQKAEILHI